MRSIRKNPPAPTKSAVEIAEDYEDIFRLSDDYFSLLYNYFKGQGIIFSSIIRKAIGGGTYPYYISRTWIKKGPILELHIFDT